MVLKEALSEPIYFDDGFWQLDVPNDNSCLFWAIALSYLLPSFGNPDELHAKCVILLGEHNIQEIGVLSNCINQFDPHHSEAFFKNIKIMHIIQTILRNRIVDYIQSHKDTYFHLITAEDSVKNIAGDENKFQLYLQKMRDTGGWGGSIEMFAASQLLDINIRLISKSDVAEPPLPFLVIVAVNALGDMTGPENHFNFRLQHSDFMKLVDQGNEALNEEDTLANLNFDKLSLDDEAPLPSYILNIPVAIPSDSDESSDEEPDDSAFKFPDNTFESPTEYIRLLPSEEKIEEGKKTKKHYQRGKIDPTMLATDPKQVTQGKRVSKILSILSSGAFSKKENFEDYKRMQVVFGLNKMRSLSSARNRSIERELNTREYSIIKSQRFGFFWDGIWQKKSLNGWVNITYKEAREFYKKLKIKKGKNAARDFRKKTQEKRGHMVPYREIRDAIKSHALTKASVRGARQLNPNAHVYLVFFDDDIISANEAFSTYDQLYSHSEGNPPVVMSGGYLVADRSHPLMGLGVELDMIIRHQTASVIRAGVYYPEPNTLALVELGKDTLDEAFSLGKSVYESPKETPILMKDITIKRKLNPQNCFRFDRNAAVVTTCPQRMLREFNAVQNHEGKIISWRHSDFKTMRGINQSHFKPRSWARNILQAIEIPTSISIIISGENFSLSDKKILGDMLVSLISRIFKAFDPIFLAKTATKLNPNSSFRSELVRVLKDYEKLQMKLYPTSRKPSKPPKKEQSPAVKLKIQNSAVIWGYLDKVTDLQECVLVLNQLLGYPNKSTISGEDVLLATKKSHLGIVTILRDRLSMNFRDLFLQSMIGLYNDFPDDSTDQFDGDPSDLPLDPAYTLLMSEEAINKKAELAGLFRSFKGKKPSVFSATPLHFAAIKGDIELVKWLIEKRQTSTIGWIGDISILSDAGLLPVHCAIRYCSEQSENYELIELLVNEHNINAVITHQDWEDLTAFTMIMLELKNPFPLLERLLKKYPGKIEFITPDIDLDDVFRNAVSERYFDFADFIVGYVPNAEDQVVDIILEMSPKVDKYIIKYAEGMGIDMDQIADNMEGIEEIDFSNNYKNAMGINSDGSSEEILDDDEQQTAGDDEFLEDDMPDQDEQGPNSSSLGY